MAKSLRSIFFDVAAALNSRGKRKNFKTDGQPDEALMQNLVDSALFFKESGDRASKSTGDFYWMEVGTMAVAPDADAKAGTSGMQGDRTLVTEPAQLPTSEAESQTVDTFTGNVLDVTAEPATTTRNQYKFKFASAFVSWLANKVLPDFGVGDSEKVVRVNTGETAYELVDSSTVGGGETNLGANVGGGVEVFRNKTAATLNFRTAVGVGSYFNVTQAGDTVEFEWLEGPYKAGVLDPLYVQAFTNAGGEAEVIKNIVTGNITARTIKQGNGITVTQNTDDITIVTDDTYINSLIDTRVAAGAGASGYLFNVSNIVEQVLPVGDVLVGADLKVVFPDETSAGRFDDGNTWATSQWTANADAVGENVEFNVNLTSELVVVPSFGQSVTVTFDLIKDDGGLTVLDTQNSVFTQGFDIVGDTNIINLQGSFTAALDDKVYVRVSVVDTGDDGQTKILAAANIYNL